MNKFPILVLFLFIFSLTLAAQDYPGGYNPDEEDNSGENVKKISPYFYFGLKFPKMTGLWATELGGGAGVFFGNKFGLGVEYYSLLSNNIRVNVTDTTSYALGLGYGGLEFTYSFFFFNFIKVTAGAMTGLGRVTNSYQNVLGVADYSVDDWFFNLEPRIKLDFRIIKGFWIDLFAGYRIPIGLKYYNLGNKDLSGPFLGIGILTF